MYRRHIFIAAAVIEALVATPSRGQVPLDQAKRDRVVNAVNTSPLLAPTMSVVREAQYVRDAQLLLADISWSSGGPPVSSVAEATKVLESLLAGSTVRAIVTSVPTRVLVKYRRLVDLNAPALSVTTDDTLNLQPATYLFIGTDPTTQATIEQRVPCASRCKVVFDFRKP